MGCDSSEIHTSTTTHAHTRARAHTHSSSLNKSHWGLCWQHPSLYSSPTSLPPP